MNEIVFGTAGQASTVRAVIEYIFRDTLPINTVLDLENKILNNPNLQTNRSSFCKHVIELITDIVLARANFFFFAQIHYIILNAR